MTGTPDPDRHDAAPDDEAWRDLVARLGGGPKDDDGAGPAPRELSAAERAAAGAPPRGPHRGLTPPDGAGFSRFDPLGIAGGHRADHSAERSPAGDPPASGDEALTGDFVPDEPEPVLAGADPVAVLAWIGALGGPVALLACALVWRTVPAYVIVLLIAAFVAGVGTLIMRLPRTKEDDGDDGARL